MNQSGIDKIQAVYINFKKKLNDILLRRKSLIGDYRKKMEDAKIKEIKDSLHI